jgi:hypothetical protein
MCSQYSAAEFPQRGDNPGTWRGSTPRGSRDRELQTHQVGKESDRTDFGHKRYRQGKADREPAAHRGSREP